MIAIIDYDMGNLRSVQKAVNRIGFECIITRDSQEMNEADKLIFPGVGHFERGIENLNKYGLIDILDELVLKQLKPVLGICLGMQLMTTFSEEGNCPGLGWVEANTMLFNFENLKVPHIGWNNLEFITKTEISKNISEEDEFYFVHSYYIKCANEKEVLFKSKYGISFDSGFQKGNILGVQFHPEKSHDSGLKILNNFLTWYNVPT
jgi:glutamine amidotransferase